MQLLQRQLQVLVQMQPGVVTPGGLPEALRWCIAPSSCCQVGGSGQLAAEQLLMTAWSD
jgi:hypothetical protein